MKTTYTLHPAMPLDFSNASRHAMGLGDSKFERGETATHSMAQSGVAFDGRSYWYRQYRYDQLADALAYARLDGARSDVQAEAGDQHHWQEPEVPTTATQKLMVELGIAFDGRCYRYDEYRYDRFVDAINYAQLTQTRSIMPRIS